MLLAIACDGPEAPRDAGAADAGVDAGRDAGRDAGAPMCTPECVGDDTCCREPSGSTVCAPLRNDPRHCGLCEIDCVASHRGDRCSASQCACGNTSLGCVGNRQSWCCPPAHPDGFAYCTDLDRSPSDCGACGAACDARISDHCDGGRCVCGNERTACMNGEVCCSNGVDVECADLATDTFNCGACNRACTAPARCELGTCTTGASCGGCEGDDVCCDGTCCGRGRCVEGVCVS